jgi:hypothetical protein
MGTPDEIVGKCPNCKTKNYFQSKSGDCTCSVYDIDKAPISVMYDANRHTPQHCSKCKKLLVVDVENRKVMLATKEQIIEKENRYKEQMAYLEGLAKKSK